MYEFPSWQSYWDFTRRVKTEERYCRSADVAAFLSAVTATSQKRLTSLTAGTILWRAQLGCEWAPHEDIEGYEDQRPHSTTRMIPLRSAPTEGRANPVGIPVLYLATNERTAIAEVRPWVGKSVSVAQFKVMRSLRVLDCSSDVERNFYLQEDQPSPEAREAAVWGDINRAFSQPASTEDDRATYIPSQILAEHFKTLGADGVVYNSSLGDGKNIALFDLAAAEVMNCALHEVRGVLFRYDEMTNPYYVAKHYPALNGEA